VFVDGYVRVSQVGGRGGASFISPTIQREQIEAWAKLNGAIVGHVFEELDESGARSDRPMLMAAIERVEASESQGIVVAKLDRFGRSLIDGLANIDRIDAAGGTFVSVQDGLDLSTPTGKLIVRIMFSMAEWELDRVRANWDMAQARAVARGVHLCGSSPFGYARAEDGHLVIDPKTAPAVAELFRRRGDGAGITSLMAYMNATGLKTARGAAEFVDSSVAGILSNRAYTGEARCGRHVNATAHTPIVDEATWQAAQRPRRARSRGRHSLLAGVLRCANCRMAMFTEVPVVKETARASYRCPGHSSAGPCPAAANIRFDEIEPLVEDLVFRSADSNKVDSRAAARVSRCGEVLERVQGELERYRDNPRLIMTLGPESFDAGLAKRQGSVERASLELARARRAAEDPGAPTRQQLEDSWPDMSIDERRDIIERIVDCIFVESGTAPILQRAHVCKRGDAPIDLPLMGRAIGAIRPFRSGKGSKSVRLRPMRSWGERRIERELKVFLGGSKSWPRYAEFSLAGQGRLHRQVMEWGGPYYWAHRLGLDTSPRLVAWTDPNIRGALRGFLARRDKWPVRAEFIAAGLRFLHKAVERHGGVAYWSGEFDLSD
jgi:DNA invertase Pin-like site-specific DNA recombinase